jgi:hypothetical protein
MWSRELVSSDSDTWLRNFRAVSGIRPVVLRAYFNRFGDCDHVEARSFTARTVAIAALTCPKGVDRS